MGRNAHVGDDPDAQWVLSTAPRDAPLVGFDLHANVAVQAADCPRPEPSCLPVNQLLTPLGIPLTGLLSALYLGGGPR